MRRRNLGRAAAAGLAGGAGVMLGLSTCAPPARQAAAPAGAKVAVIELEKGGTVTVELFPELAPKTVANFEQKANNGFYNGLTFHRAEDWIVQGGDPRGNGTGGQFMPSELNRRPFIAGSVGVPHPRNDPRISNDSQFFICLKPAPHLDGEFTNFGQVINGLEVARTIRAGDKIKRITVKGSGPRAQS